MTPRERFCYAMVTGPLLKADAIVVLCGEDAEPRIEVATGMVQSGAAPKVVLSGGVDQPPRWMGAKRLRPLLMGAGVAPDRIVVDEKPKNTREQAVNAVRMAVQEDWTRMLVVASAYHCPRAHLTFLKALQEAECDTEKHVLMVPVSHKPWFAGPDGVVETRLDLFDRELAKVEAYQAKGHVASYADGLAYLKHWEGL